MMSSQSEVKSSELGRAKVPGRGAGHLQEVCSRWLSPSCTLYAPVNLRLMDGCGSCSPNIVTAGMRSQTFRCSVAKCVVKTNDEASWNMQKRSRPCRVKKKKKKRLVVFVLLSATKGTPQHFTITVCRHVISVACWWILWSAQVIPVSAGGISNSHITLSWCALHNRKEIKSSLS